MESGNQLPGVAVASMPISVREGRRSYEGRRELKKRGVKNTGRHIDDMSNKAFLGWDGEGITPEGVATQNYVLFGHSGGQYITAESLNTKQCLDFMIQSKRDFPDHIMVGFAITYDAEMILKDLTPKHLERLHKQTRVRWGPYRIEYLPNKWFQVSMGTKDDKVTCKIWDVWSFFACSFVKAIRQYLPEENIDDIVSGKAMRRDFTTDQLKTDILPYWAHEVILLAKMMHRLRDLLYKANLYPNMWHGPGAIANYLNRTHNTKQAMNNDLPRGVMDAAQFAFAAGRIEQFKVGRIGQAIYRYDLNSAYPAAMTELPALTGKWDYSTNVHKEDVQQYGLYYLEFSQLLDSTNNPKPLFHRTRSAHILFPAYTNGWYWGPEVLNVVNYYPSNTYNIKAGWILENTESRPFAWVGDMYEERLEMKRRGEQSQLALKLGLNSLYGKTAQRVGYDTYQKIPKWHQYEWAGYITSRTRARLFEAAMLASEHNALIALETDAVFSMVELALPCSEQLGEWGYDTFEDCIYLQSGVYWLLNDKGDWQSKFRGMDPETLTIDKSMTYLAETRLDVNNVKDYSAQTMKGLMRHRFVGSKACLHTGKFEEWRNWKDECVQLMVGNSFKRTHVPAICETCLITPYANCMPHNLASVPPPTLMSYASALPWRTVEHESELWDEERES